MEDSWNLLTYKFNHNCYATSSSLVLPYSIDSTKILVIVKEDSAASNHYLTAHNKYIHVKIRFDPTEPTIVLLNLVFLSSTKTGYLPITDLISNLGKKISIFENL